MSCVLAVAAEDESVEVFGTRHSALNLRDRISKQLDSGQDVQVDFHGVFVTQSFVDELFGSLILRMGPALLERLTFSGCSPETRAILNLVFASRLKDFSLRQASPVRARNNRA